MGSTQASCVTKSSKRSVREEMRIFCVRRGQQYNLESMLGRGGGRPSRHGEHLGKAGLEAQESRVCVCEGGEKVSIQDFHGNLNGALSIVRERAKCLQEKPSFYSKILAQYLFIYLFTYLLLCIYINLSILVCITFH